MVCIYCGAKTQVINSRLQKRLNSVWRRRACPDCQAVVSTTEILDPASAIIVTDQGRQQPFSRDKLFISIYESCKHRKTAQKDATALTETILSQLYPLISNAALSRASIIETTDKILQRFDKAAATYYASYHPINS